MMDDTTDIQASNESTRLLKSEGDDTVTAPDSDTDGSDSELTGCGATLACDPRRALHRYLLLIVLCFLSFGSYYCYDSPTSLQDTIKNDLDIDTSQFMLFYSLYSWPNVILCFFGGFLLDKVFGVRLGTIIFSTIVTAGHMVFAFGAVINRYWLMNVGRFIFGLGGESLCVAQNTYTVGWFGGRELNMVFGLQLSFSRAGSTLSMNAMKPIYDAMDTHFNGHVCLGVALFVGGIFAVISLVCAFVMAYFDKRAARILRKEQSSSGDTIQFTDIKDFNGCFWLLSIICVMYYVAVFPFIALGLVFFEMKFLLEPAQASAVNSLVYIISAVASPVFGLCIDKVGKNVFWVMGGIIMTLACHALLTFTFLNPYIAMVSMGFSYSILASALWPMVSLIVPQHQIGTAYGIMQSVQNLGLAVVPIIAGKIVDSKGYMLLEMFFMGCLCVALIATTFLYLLDAAKGGTLNKSAKRRRMEQCKELESSK